MKIKEINIIRIALVIQILFQGCSSNIELISKWANQSITIDGKDNDWENKTIYVKEENFLIGIQNDNEYLYLTLITTDRNVQTKIFGRGLTVWFDREGGKGKNFGVKFPLGLMDSEIFPMRPNLEENTDLLDKMFEKEQTELEILIPANEETIRMDRSQASGINSKISRTEDRMIYEMKIALKPDNKNLYGIGIFPAKQDNSKIGIGFETGEINREEIKEKMMTENVDREKIKKMEGRRGGRMKGSGMRDSIPESIKYWISVQLSMIN